MELNKIYNENCLNTMAAMPDDFIDLTITSPPYDNLKNYKGYFFQFEEIAAELFRVTKNGGVVVWVVGDETRNGNESGTSFKQVLFFQQSGFNLHDTMIWHKTNSFNFGSNNCYRQSFEYMFILSKGKPKTIHLIKDVVAKLSGQTVNGARKHPSGKRDAVPAFVVPEYKRRDNVWNMPTASANYGHPAVFPEQLVKDHIITWSNENDLVYDPFMGSGTTAKVAAALNRKYIGSEISKEYIMIAKNRLNEYCKNLVEDELV